MNSPLHLHHQPGVSLLNLVQEVWKLFTTNRLCWKHLNIRDNRADNDGSTGRGLITHHVPN